MKMRYILYTLVLMFGAIQCVSDTTVMGTSHPTGRVTLEVSSDSSLLTINESGESGEILFRSRGGEVALDVLTNQDSWQYEALDAEWLTLESNDYALTISALRNNTNATRVATITIIAGQNDAAKRVTIAISQNHSEVPEVNLSEYDVYFKANTDLTRSIEVETNCDDWDFQVSSTWLLVEKSETGLVLTADKNTTTALREVEITITAGKTSAKLIVCQEGKAFLELDVKTIVADYNGGTKHVVVKSNPELELKFDTSEATWFSVMPEETGFAIAIEENGSDAKREGWLNIQVGYGGNSEKATVHIIQNSISDAITLIYEIETTVSDHKIIAAPVLTSAGGGKIEVNWGDGSEIETFESRRGVHTYAEPGVYTISITGEAHNLEFSDGSHICPELKRIHSWGKMGYKNAANMCKGCVNLESIPDDIAGSFEDVGSFVAAFLGCEKLKEIPEGLFQHAVEAKKFSNCFRYTTSLSEIPENLFANSPLAEEFYYTFYGAGSDFAITDESLAINAGDYHKSYPAELEQPIADGKLRSVPAALFSKCPKATRFEYLFAATAIEAIPETIFAANSSVENFQGTFYACMNLQSIPAKLMEKATAALNIKYMFAGCTSLTEVPVALFENCTEVTNLEALFYKSSGIKSIKKGTFKGLSKVKTIGSVFQGCASLTDVEAGVFEGLTSAKSFPYCFADCTSLRSIPEGLLAGMSAAYEFESMFANTAIESVPEGLFDEVRDYDLGDYAYIFAECKNLKTVPAKLFDHVTEASSGGFNNIFYKSGIETIPAGLFVTCTNVDATSFEAVFMGCPELHTVEGSIFPEVTTITSMKQIFYNCPKLVNIPADLFKPFGTAKLKFTNAFTGCTSLKTLPEGLFSTCTMASHFTSTFADCTALESIPENLLSACESVTYVDGMFVGCTALKTIPEKLFANCPKIGTFEETFAECTALESIPEKLFSALSGGTKSVTFSKCFYGCSALKSIPAGLFDAARRINFIDNCFNGCTALTGESPYTMIGEKKVHLYERTRGTDFPVVPSNNTAHADCFAGCSGLSDYADMPMMWR